MATQAETVATVDVQFETPQPEHKPNVQLYVLYIQSGKTMREIAMECGVTISAISKVIGGSRRPSLETAVDLARCFDVSIETIVEATGMKWGRAKWDLGIRPDVQPQDRHQSTILRKMKAA